MPIGTVLPCPYAAAMLVVLPPLHALTSNIAAAMMHQHDEGEGLRSAISIAGDRVYCPDATARVMYSVRLPGSIDHAVPAADARDRILGPLLAHAARAPGQRASLPAVLILFGDCASYSRRMLDDPERGERRGPLCKRTLLITHCAGILAHAIMRLLGPPSADVKMRPASLRVAWYAVQENSVVDLLKLAQSGDRAPVARFGVGAGLGAPDWPASMLFPGLMEVEVCSSKDATALGQGVRVGVRAVPSRSISVAH